MARRASLKLDSKGLEKAMQTVIAPQLEEAAKKVAAAVPRPTAVQMGLDRNGRPLAMVAITLPNGLAIQARTGVLTRAAAGQGMDIHRYPPPS
ncbi:hypothetical protein M3B38_01740 [Dietzia cinnamea]|uniref:hypothetical protein n=1 Tax=Dietzia cinnamea TaxID=321318 RepID=UPI0021A41B6C|nr:hypothetical protein [Dietzia cinnamea]MCT1710710.1 hypothetical protein [Dietzia cinnamea]